MKINSHQNDDLCMVSMEYIVQLNRN